MRKLIRVASVAFLVWAITTFAWAALSHVTGVTGPAEASGASLDFVAGAITFVDPPGVLGVPQRFAARQIRQTADAVERIHRGPERLAARLVDEMGHRHRHDGNRRRHRHRHVVRIEHDIGQHTAEVVREALAGVSFGIPIDELDQARAHAEARAVIELNRHRNRIDVDRDGRRIEFRRQLNDRERERIERALEQVRQRLERLSAEKDGEWRRELEKRLRDILRELEKELGEVRVIELDESIDIGDFELQELESDDEDRVVRIHVRDR